MVVLSCSWAFFALSFTIFTKKQGRISSNSDSGYKIQKNICGGKIYSHTRSTQIEYSSPKKHEILIRFKIQDFSSNYLLIKSNRTAFSWMSLRLAPPPSFPRREHSTLTFPHQAQGNFLDSIFLTSESSVRQAFTGLSALTGTSIDESRPVTLTVDHQ